jgi:hypothetical protein
MNSGLDANTETTSVSSHGLAPQSIWGADGWGPVIGVAAAIMAVAAVIVDAVILWTKQALGDGWHLLPALLAMYAVLLIEILLLPLALLLLGVWRGRRMKRRVWPLAFVLLGIGLIVLGYEMCG